MLKKCDIAVRFGQSFAGGVSTGLVPNACSVPSVQKLSNVLEKRVAHTKVGWLQQSRKSDEKVS